jgi:hypothetical protein
MIYGDTIAFLFLPIIHQSTVLFSGMQYIVCHYYPLVPPLQMLNCCQSSTINLLHPYHRRTYTITTIANMPLSLFKEAPLHSSSYLLFIILQTFSLEFHILFVIITHLFHYTYLIISDHLYKRY